MYEKKDNRKRQISKKQIPVILTIDKAVKESCLIKTFVFKHKLNALPGQFINIWIPGLDEKPMSISYQDNNRFAFSAASVGPFTKALHNLKQGDKLGIRGPYGNGFDLKDYKNIIIIGGGCGCAPVMFLANYAKLKRLDPLVIIGAKTKDEVPFMNRVSKAYIKTIYSTDDGSLGFKGFATQLLEKLVLEKIKKKGKIDCVFCCGPEIMMKKVVEICNKNNIDCQVSLERYMKCGFGLCGQCAVDPHGWCVCKEGPVFDKEKINQITEFGKYKRDQTGSKVLL